MVVFKGGVRNGSVDKQCFCRSFFPTSRKAALVLVALAVLLLLKISKQEHWLYVFSFTAILK